MADTSKDERRAEIGRRNMPRHITSLYNAHSK